MKSLNQTTILIVSFMLLLTIPSQTLAQSNHFQKLIDKPHSILFSPLSLIDPYNPSFQLGYEHVLTQKWAVQMEVAHVINKALFHYIINPTEDADEFANNGYKVRLELKRILMNKRAYRIYCSSELYFLKNVSSVINQFKSNPSYDYGGTVTSTPLDEGWCWVYTDYFTNNRTKYSLNVKAGMKYFDDDFFYEAYIGCGIAFRNNKHSDRKNIDDAPVNDSYWNDNLQGAVWMPTLPMSFKIGYQF